MVMNGYLGVLQLTNPIIPCHLDTIFPCSLLFFFVFHITLIFVQIFETLYWLFGAENF
jgi:hypothetical protein